MTPLSWSTIGRVALAVFAAWVLVQTWMVLLTAVILAAAILPAARWGDQRHIPRLVTVIAVYAGFALVFAVLGRFLVPALAEQTREFVQHFRDVEYAMMDKTGHIGLVTQPERFARIVGEFLNGSHS